MRPENRKSWMVREWLKKAEADGFRFYCVSCKRQRLLSPPARVGSSRFFAQVLITTGFFTALAWPWMGAKGFLAFLLPVGLFLETAYRLKMRQSMVCPDCSFDPILYLIDRKKAALQVEEAWKKKFEEKGIPFPTKPSTSAATRRPLDLRD